MATVAEPGGRLEDFLARAALPCRWQSSYWTVAAVPVAFLYAFEALQIFLFETVRAPNVTPVAQLGLMFGFFALWPLAARWAWAAIERFSAGPDRSPFGLLPQLALVGLLASALHLAVLAAILRVMHSPPGWGAGHMAVSIGETWLGYGGFWFLLYALACFVMLRVRAGNAAPQAATARIEVRQGRNFFALAPGEIVWIEAAGNYVEIRTERGSFVKRATLAELEETLGSTLIRSHRAALVNPSHMESIRRNGGRGDGILMSNGDMAPLSRRHVRAAREALRRG